MKAFTFPTDRLDPMPTESGARAAWLRHYLPWLDKEKSLFRPINSSPSWTHDKAMELYSGPWANLAYILADPTIGEIQVQPLTDDPSRLSVITQGPKGTQIHPRLEMTADQLLDGMGHIITAGVGASGLRNHLASTKITDEVILKTFLDDGPRTSRICGVVPPASNAPVLSIRRFPVAAIPLAVVRGLDHLDRHVHPYAYEGEPLPSDSNPLEDLLGEAEMEGPVPWAALPVRALCWLLLQFSFEKNITVFGPTFSGKTSMLQTILSQTNPNERCISVEVDAQELHLPHINRLSLFCTDEGDEKRTPPPILGAILRLTPEILPYGELRGKEAYTYLQAVQSGHKGLTTIHAKNMKSALGRLISMAGQGAPAAASADDIRSDVLRATNILVHVRKQNFASRQNVRRVVEIVEIDLDDNDKPNFHQIFRTIPDANGAPCLQYTGDPGTLIQDLNENFMEVPPWLKPRP